MRIAIVKSRFNLEVVDGLYQGALEVFREEKISYDAETDLYLAPGAFELPLIAKKLAQTGSYAGVVCLGCVIKGDTAHFEFISLGAATGISQAALETETPISFGVLTTYDDEQALKRSRPGPENKGREAALACIETARVLNRIG